MISTLLVISAIAMQPAAASPAAPASTPTDWRSAEAPLLSGHVQLTRREQFIKAGEAYFNAVGTRVIFQAIQVPPADAAPDQFYSMFVADLARDAAGVPTGLANITRVSPLGSANTCGWFHPTDSSRVLFGSTLVPPSAKEKPGFQVGTSRYVWQFPEEMEVVTASLTPGHASDATALFHRPGYDAECSFSNDGRFVLYANVDPTKAKPDGHQDADIFIFDTQTKTQRAIVVAPGYDGGPFFSPDGNWICYRSDRAGNDLLQVYVAKLKFETDASGTRVPVGIEREYQLTHNEHVNWGPYWHPSGGFLVYATSQVSHRNYEVFAIQSDLKALDALDKVSSIAAPATIIVPDVPTRRVTHADGADVLPVFTPDGAWMMWTSQRGPLVAGEEKPSSQLWLARWNQSSAMFDAVPASPAAESASSK